MTNNGESSIRQEPVQAARRPPEKRVGELLVEADLITPGQLQEALDLQKSRGGKTVDNLIALGHLDVDAFVKFLAKRPGMASIDLSQYEIPKEVVSLVPKEFAIAHEVFPIDKLGSLLTLGMVCPLDRITIGKLEEATKLRIKPILCSPEDIRKAIQRYYPSSDATTSEAPASVSTLASIETSMRLTSVAALVRKMDSLPVLPETVQRVREAMQDPNRSVGEVAEIITLDPPLAAKVLSVANSAAYGFPRRVDNLTLAVSLLGLRETYTIVLSAAVLDVFEKSAYFDYKRFWVEAMCVAAAARVVAKACLKSQQAGVFAAGLLHDIGRVVLAEVAPKPYAKVGQELDGLALVAAEEQILGLAHTEAGFELASHWSLPPEIAAAIRCHHHPEQAADHQDMAAMVSLADVLAHSRGKTVVDNKGLFDDHATAMNILGIDAETAEAMLEEFLARRDESLGDALA
ncbi:MAG TPA: HDOD domain-containing protein [Candidatus Hydrogenedentes bacterium]|nr:HDOD domain-containing protein [Candidatus Hydrogenedentota bacterium]HOS02802.1 HDOD domain-containing protein [Candidatus Hydrogenedentota bacterium]